MDRERQAGCGVCTLDGAGWPVMADDAAKVSSDQGGCATGCFGLIGLVALCWWLWSQHAERERKLEDALNIARDTEYRLRLLRDEVETLEARVNELEYGR